MKNFQNPEQLNFSSPDWAWEVEKEEEFEGETSQIVGVAGIATATNPHVGAVIFCWQADADGVRVDPEGVITLEGVSFLDEDGDEIDWRADLADALRGESWERLVKSLIPSFD